MSMTTITTAFRDFKVALTIGTQKLTRDERLEAITLAESFVERLKIELAADRKGWDVPRFGSEEWAELERTFREEIV